MSKSIPTGQLIDEDVKVLTQARDLRWRLESYEYAYDTRIRKLYLYKVVLEFLAVLIAVVFLFIQYVAKDHSTRAHDILGVIGTGLSLAVILIVIWGHMARWTDQIEKKRELSRRCRELIGEHSNLSDLRPVAQDKLKKWIRICEGFEDERKHELATLPSECLQAGHQHVGNTHVREGVLCLKCNRQWTQDMNQITRIERIFSSKCDACGVPHAKADGRSGGAASEIHSAG